MTWYRPLQSTFPFLVLIFIESHIQSTMEIDFLGRLNSPEYSMEHRPEDLFSHSDGVETSLSLCTSNSTIDCRTKILNFPEKIKSSTYYIPSKTEQPSPVHPPVRPIFLYDLNDRPTAISNNVSAEIPPGAASLNMTYSYSAGFTDTSQEKADKAVCGVPNDARIPINGHTPTVAMARRATLARFLEKRLHRLDQTRASHLIGKQLNPTSCEGSSKAITRSNEKRANNFIH